MSTSPESVAWQNAAVDSSGELRNIILFAYLYPPDREVGALRPARLAKYLGRLGHSVTVIAAGERDELDIGRTVHRLRGDVWDRYPPTTWEKVFRKTLGVMGWGAAWALRAGGYAARLADRRTVFVSTAPPFAVHAAAAWASRRCAAPWIADFRDPLPGFALRTHRAIAARYERYVAHAADVVLANTTAAAERWRGRYPEAASKFVLLPNGFDPEDPISPAPIPERDYRVLLHAGSIYNSRSPGLVLRAFSRLLDSGDPVAADVQIHLIGRMEAAPRADSALQRLVAAGRVMLFPEQPIAEARRAMAESDLLLLLDLLEGPNAGCQIGAKLYDYVQLGRPILLSATRGSASERILAESGIPYVALHPDDGDADLERKVRSFLRFSSAPRPAAQTFLQQFAAPEQALQLHRIIEALPARRL